MRILPRKQGVTMSLRPRRFTATVLCAVGFTLFLSAGTLFAAEVSAEQAKTAVRNWIRRNPRPMTARFASSDGEARTFTKNDRALFHVLQLDDGGFVVTSGDTKISPIIAFSDNGSFDADTGNPLFALLNRDMSARLESVAEEDSTASKQRLLKAAASAPLSSASGEKTENEAAWEDLLAESSASSGGRLLKSVASSSQLDDVRVEPMIKTEWDQSTWGNYSNTPNAYNYNTPGNSVCGCVATAGSQIMNFWQHPKNAVPQSSFQYVYNGKAYATTIGGAKYSWSSMPVAYSASPAISAAQIEAVGRLTYEVGVASSMSYTSKGSGTWGCIMMRSFKSVFGYASAVGMVTDYDIGIGNGANIRDCILASLDAGMPGTIGVFSTSGGHEIVTDGYGFKGGTLYVHLNCGWSGSQNAWYQLFGEKLTTHNYHNIGEVCFNIHPSETGDIVSGRVLGQDGRPVPYASVTVRNPNGGTTALTANSKGAYFFRVNATGTYIVKASGAGGESKESSVVFSKLSETSDLWRDFNAQNFPCRISVSGSSANKWGVDLTLESASGVEPVLEQVAAPVFSPSDGMFTSSSISVTISCSTAGATIYYTRNGTTPTTSSTKYTGPVVVSSTTQFKAIAVKSGMTNSDVVSKTYTKGSATITPAQGMDWSGTVSISSSSAVYGQRAITHDGEDATVLCTSTRTAATASITVTGPGNLSFWCLADSFFASYSCLIDGKSAKGNLGLSGVWEYVSIPVVSGYHTITWSVSSPFAAFGSFPVTGYLDEVSFESFPGGTCRVTYYANGADGGYLERSGDSGAFAGTVTVPGCGTLYRNGYAFLGWSTSQTATSAQYLSGTKMNLDALDKKLYAVWKPCIVLLAEIPQSGGKCEVPLDKCYGSSYLVHATVPNWAGSMSILEKVHSNTVVYGGGWDSLSFDKDSTLAVSFSANENDTAEDRSFDVDLIAMTYAYVIRCHVVQKADVTSSKAKNLVIETENGGGFLSEKYVTGGTAEKFVARIVRRNGQVDGVNASWSIVKGGAYASISGGILTTVKVDAPQTVTILAKYTESGVNYSAEQEISINPRSSEWVGPNCYGIVYEPGESNVQGTTGDQSVPIGVVAKLNPCGFVHPAGKKFAGWRREGSGRRYDDGMLVFNLAEPGEIVTLTAIWE